MKKNDTGDFCVLYLEASDEKSSLFQVIAAQKKPVVILLEEQTQVFQRPDDFSALKHVKRQLDLPIVFVIPNSTHCAQMAARNGFPVYLSIDALADALTAGHMTRQRKTSALTGMGEQKSRKTVPLTSGEYAPIQRKTVPLTSGEHAPQKKVALASGEYTSLSGTSFISHEDPATPQKGIAFTSGEYALKPEKNRPFSSGEHAPAIIHTIGQDTMMEEEISFARTAPLVEDVPPFSRLEASEPLYPPRPSRPLRSSGPLQATQLTQQAQQVQRAKPLSQPSLMTPHTQPKRRFSLLLAVLTFALVIAGLGSFLVLAHSLPTNAAAPILVGQLTFSSSEQLSENSSQGIEDQITVDLTNLPAPAAHKSYYAWLLGDKAQSDPKAILLGTLAVNNGKAHLFYGGDTQHSNLLLIASRFLVTEEDATMTPISPSPDQTSWRYYGEFSSTPINSPDNPKHFSFLDHLRHLLAADPTLDELELPGGLNNWLYRNTGKVLEWAGSTREQWEDTKDAGFVRRQTTRILSYLDGTSFVRQDLPPGASTLVNDRLASIGLVNVNGPNQDPPCYMTHVVSHLNGLLQAGGSTAQLRKQEADLITAMNDVDHWLTQVRHDAQQIMKMSDQQLQQPGTLSLLNDMIDNATHAYAGQLDPSSGQMRQGVIWIHDHMQSLATLGVNTFTAPNTSLQMIPDTKHPKASVVMRGV